MHIFDICIVESATSGGLGKSGGDPLSDTSGHRRNFGTLLLLKVVAALERSDTGASSRKSGCNGGGGSDWGLGIGDKEMRWVGRSSSTAIVLF